MRDGQPLYFVMEVSKTVGANDVMRPNRRAEIGRQAGLRAVAAVAGEDRLPEGAELAAEEGVLVITDGTMRTSSR